MFTLTVPNLVYGAVLLLVLVTPFVAPHLPGPARVPGGSLISGVIVMAACALTLARDGGVAPLVFVLLLPLQRRGLAVLLGGMAAVLLFAPVTWWSATPKWPFPASLVFVGLAVVALGLARGETSPEVAPRRRAVPLWVVLLVCAGVGLVAGAFTAPFAFTGTSFMAWHHWGAYLSPVEAWLAGGRPWRDFPMQYGLGPTFLLTMTCGTDCWRGLYGSAITANALYFATLAGCVSTLTPRASRGLKVLGLLALFCATFLWTGFPPLLVGPALTPSVAGLRFLPVSALLLATLAGAHRRPPRDRPGHLLWAICLFWSPEAAAFGTVLWWPSLALRDASTAGTLRDALVVLGQGAVRGAGAVGVGLLALAGTVWLISGSAARPDDYLAYLLHPPALRPANPTGPVWFALAAIGLAVAGLAKRGRTTEGRGLHACVLAFLAAGAYFLSHSHDNNILNLFPFLTMVLLGLLTKDALTNTPASAFGRGFGLTGLAAMIAFVATFNLTLWTEGTAVLGLELGPELLIERFTPSLEDPSPILAADAVAGLTELRERDAGAVVLLDERAVMPAAPPGTAWTSVNNLANYLPLPPETIRRYIQRGAQVYHRPGWVLIDETKYRPWLDHFLTAYDVREHRVFGDYGAYALEPR